MLSGVDYQLFLVGEVAATEEEVLALLFWGVFADKVIFRDHLDFAFDGFDVLPVFILGEYEFLMAELLLSQSGDKLIVGVLEPSHIHKGKWSEIFGLDDWENFGVEIVLRM